MNNFYFFQIGCFFQNNKFSTLKLNSINKISFKKLIYFYKILKPSELATVHFFLFKIMIYRLNRT